MKPKKLSINKLVRSGRGNQKKRTSINFNIDGESLLDKLSTASGGHTDYMGCFVKGVDDNSKIYNAFTCKENSDLEEGRVLLYICPECGDIGCGAYAAKIEKNNNQYLWQDFAYVNGYEDAVKIEGVGPYYFNENEYEEIINEAKNI
jgi:hypothetical protein